MTASHVAQALLGCGVEVEGTKLQEAGRRRRVLQRGQDDHRVREGSMGITVKHQNNTVRIPMMRRVSI